MKKLFSFISVFALAATLGISTVSAQKTIITAEKLWSNPIANMTAVAEARQGTGYNGVVYVADKASHSVLAYSKADGNVVQDTVITNPAIVSTAIAVDDAGNIVLAASAAGGNWFDAPVQLLLVDVATKTLDTLAITAAGRTDFISAVGNVRSAEGGYVYLYSNSAKAQAIHIVNGIVESSAVLESSAAAGSGGQVVYFGTPSAYVAQVRASALQFVGVEAVTLPDIYNSKLGLDVFTIAGKTIYAYNIKGAAAYTSSFQLYNTTDAALVPDMNGATELFAVDATKTQSTSCANWLRATVIDENTAYVHQYCGSDGAAVWKVSAVVAATVTLNCDTTMGTVEGAGDFAVGGNATVKAIPALGHSFVAWLNGADTVSTKAEYTFPVEKDVTLTAVFQKENDVKLTLAVNDATKGAITLPEGIVLGENTLAYGTKVALTAAPAEGATFTGWTSGDAAYSADYTIEVAMTADLALTANFTNVLKVEYVLGGGITNDYGWLSKAHMCLDLQNDYNTTYNTSKAWVKEENGVVYYYVSGAWKLPAEVEGSAADVAGFLQASTYNTADHLVKLLQTEKWAALGDYINGLRTAAGFAVADEGAMRADLSGFFLNSPAITDYRHTNDYSVAGQPSAFCRVMQMGFDNPTEVIRETVLNDPYHPELTFYGWYDNAEFTGEKYTTVSPETVLPAGKLYAKLAEYIPTIAEVWAMEEGTETLISGVVNWARKGNVFIQDATGGFLIYNSGLEATVGTKIVAKGTRGSFNGKPQVSNATIVSSEKGELLAPVVATLATFLADSTSLKYFGQRVQVLGVYVAEYDSYGNLWVADKDGSNKIQCYYITPDQTTFPVGKKISITAVASSNKGIFQFEGDVAGVELVTIGKKDKFEYPVRQGGRYTLKNNWVISKTEDNFAANKPGTDDYVRGMAAKDGIMYFINRETKSIVRVDGKTGEMLDPIVLQGTDTLFKSAAQDSVGNKVWSDGTTLPYNDIKFDQAGNCLIGACLTGASKCQTFYIYVVDLATGVCTKLIEDVLWDNPGLDQVQFRFDAFGAAGDVTKNGVVMAADANGTWNVYRWLIEDGVAGEGEQVPVLLDKEVDESLFIEAAGYGTAPQIFPQDEEGTLFYVDGFNTLPMLFYGTPEEGATLIDDFINVPTGVKVWNNDTISMNANFNGLVEFQVGEEYFLLMVAANNTHSVPTTYALYKFADADRAFSGMEPLWYFPKDGLGTATIGCRTAVPSVDVVSDTEATLYLYATNNGYASYTLTIDPTTAVEDIETVKVEAKKIIVNGQIIIEKNGVKYNMLGAEIK